MEIPEEEMADFPAEQVRRLKVRRMYEALMGEPLSKDDLRNPSPSTAKRLDALPTKSKTLPSSED